VQSKVVQRDATEHEAMQFQGEVRSCRQGFDKGFDKDCDEVKEEGGAPPYLAVPPSQGLQTLMILTFYPSQQASQGVPEPSQPGQPTGSGQGSEVRVRPVQFIRWGMRSDLLEFTRMWSNVVERFNGSTAAKSVQSGGQWARGFGVHYSTEPKRQVVAGGMYPPRPVRPSGPR
jgi:hypothetical protein